MSSHISLNHPWLVAVWPGMGNVGITAGYYLMAKLGMTQFAEFSPVGAFDIEHVEVERGLIRMGRIPRGRLFVWHDPDEKRDLVVLLGEAQPATGRYVHSQKLIEYVKDLGIERVFTFAAMATQMRLESESRVFGAATDGETLKELTEHGVELVEDGNVSGLNGVLVGTAAEADLSGTCLLGEMPHIFAQFVFPKASLAILESFKAISGFEFDTSELYEQSQAMQRQLGNILSHLERAMGSEERPSEEFHPEPEPESRLSPQDEVRIEALFDESKHDRSKAYLLKQELDRLGVFREYEDRFLDLFRKTE